MNVLNIEHVSKIFGDKKYLMIFLMESMMVIRLVLSESMEQEKVLCLRSLQGKKRPMRDR